MVGEPESVSGSVDTVDVRTGTDIQSIASFQEMDPAVRRRVIERVFVEHEREYCDRTARPAQHYAARWSAKEAFVKCVDPDQFVPLSEVSVTRQDGAPSLSLTERTKAAITSSFGDSCRMRELAFDVSLSHDSTSMLAMATVVVCRATRSASGDAAREG